MAAGGQSRAIKKLQQALIYEGELVLLTTSQFYSQDKHRVVTRYHVKKQLQDEENKNKSTIVEVFASCSQIQVCLFLRDYYYSVIGQEIPHDNPIWEEFKATSEYFKE